LNLFDALMLTSSIAFIPGIIIAIVNSTLWKKPKRLKDQVPNSVSVLVPCRNESKNIAACVKTILMQGEVVKEILIYDDESTDTTSSEIDKLISNHPAAIKRIPTQNKPKGWTGKNHACAQLASSAKGDWLLFIDADTRLQKDAITTLLGTAKRKDVSFISAWPKITMTGYIEKLLMPLLNNVVFTMFPAPLADIKSDKALGLAHGACIMVKSEVYFAVGGHTRVRTLLFEDTMLARTWRRSGYKSTCIDGSKLISVRMYETFNDIVTGFTKNYYPAFRHQRSFWGFQIWNLSWTLIPLACLVGLQYGFASIWILLALFLSITPRLVLAVRFSHTIWSVFLHPITNLVMLYIGTISYLKWGHRGGVEWKGRSYSKQETDHSD
tara:strand:+ start:2451 stop:3596 length:1146 start_codon:yes stop_codon:yes gene_type:complete